jgi:hypothetical protein
MRSALPPSPFHWPSSTKPVQRPARARTVAAALLVLAAAWAPAQAATVSYSAAGASGLLPLFDPTLGQLQSAQLDLNFNFTGSLDYRFITGAFLGAVPTATLDFRLEVAYPTVSGGLASYLADHPHALQIELENRTIIPQAGSVPVNLSRGLSMPASSLPGLLADFIGSGTFLSLPCSHRLLDETRTSQLPSGFTYAFTESAVSCSVGVTYTYTPGQPGGTGGTGGTGGRVPAPGTMALAVLALGLTAAARRATRG